MYKHPPSENQTWFTLSIASAAIVMTSLSLGVAAVAILRAQATSSSLLGSSPYDAIGTPFFLAEEVDSRARCLDGSSGVIYVSPSPSNNATYVNPNWVIGSRWGGWCSLDVPLDLTPLGADVEHTVDHCYSRSLYYKGSTVNVTRDDVSLTGNIANGARYVSRDPEANPAMWDWNFAWLLYCDGTSLGGRLDEPVVAHGPLGERELHFAGSRIRDAAFSLLRDRFGLGGGDGGNVVITGQSAGGLASMLHLNWWGESLGDSYDVLGVADGGYFPDYDTSNATFHEHFVESYGDQMRYLYDRFDLDVNRDCVEHFSSNGGDAGPEACAFAQHSFQFLKHPVFVLNSRYDEWQLKQMLGFTSPEYSDDINAYGATLAGSILASVDGEGGGGDLRHGAFVDSCVHHLANYELQIEGVTAMRALTDWVYAHVSDDWEDVRQVYFDDSEWPCEECCHRQRVIKMSDTLASVG